MHEASDHSAWSSAHQRGSVNGIELRAQLVAHLLAAAPGESRRTHDKALPLPLAAPGGESSDAAAVWRHARQDRGAAVASGIGGLAGGAGSGEGWGGRGVYEIDWKNGISGVNMAARR
jgi:hypothetical protein